ncbi:MAG: hypothetical protein L3J39_07080 [Verrucomicrobiales bacterium]|nr:hypothetical protein [Verrucomicrobiales bacterium]
MKPLLNVCVLLSLFWVNESKGGGEYDDKYYEGLAAMSFYNSSAYYSHINNRDDESALARGIVMESFTYFVNKEKEIIHPSSKVEKAILYACNSLKKKDQHFFSDPYLREDNNDFVVNPNAISSDEDYRVLVSKFLGFIKGKP